MKSVLLSIQSNTLLLRFGSFHTIIPCFYQIIEQ